MYNKIYEKNPNPIFARENSYVIHDGWEFSFDRMLWNPINLPFCPQSVLSGIGYTDFIKECYYRKKLKLNKSNKRVILHFGAVDYRAVLFINDKYVGMHIGGYTPFSFDITDFLGEQENDILLAVYDEEALPYPSGKQSKKRNSYGCFYTRTTGIWQSVWIEEIPEEYIEDFRFYPDVHSASVEVALFVKGSGNYTIEVFLDDERTGSVSGEISYETTVTIPLATKKLWTLGEGNLYHVKLSFGDDNVYSYFGLREVKYESNDFILNDSRVFQKMVLDQGYYPDGIYTAPSIEAMQQDIDRGMSLGFNGVRLHQKVFDPIFLYLCDKAGYMVWGEFASWGVDYTNLDGYGQFLAEWGEVLKRDFNHPSIITWCPLNEVWDPLDGSKKKNCFSFIEGVYQFTKAYDSTRPCVDVSGGYHTEGTDLYDFHCYESYENLEQYLDALEKQDLLEVPLLYAEYGGARYRSGQPVNISEFGGIALNENVKSVATVNEGAVTSEEPWSYGQREVDGERFVERYIQLVSLFFRCRKLSGFCYTQLYDIEQEQNGFYNYDRTDKLTDEQKIRIRKMNEKGE